MAESGDKMAKIHTILCIEDDRFIGEMYVRSLRQAGYEVDWVVSGKDGLAVAKSKPYDLILLDVMLPEQKGSEILAALRGEKDLIPNTKILVMTNFDLDDKERIALQRKVDGYLTKADITPGRLLEVITSLN